MSGTNSNKDLLNSIPDVVKKETKKANEFDPALMVMCNPRSVMSAIVSERKADKATFVQILSTTELDDEGRQKHLWINQPEGRKARFYLTKIAILHLVKCWNTLYPEDKLEVS